MKMIQWNWCGIRINKRNRANVSEKCDSINKTDTIVEVLSTLPSAVSLTYFSCCKFGIVTEIKIDGLIYWKYYSHRRNIIINMFINSNTITELILLNLNIQTVH